MRAVRFDQYGGLEVLKVMEVPRPVPESGQVLVKVKAAGINPGEVSIREGYMHDRWPATFPSGQGSDLAGVIEEVGEGVEGFRAGDEVIGFTENRASHAELVLVEADHLTPRPPGVPWEVAGALFVVGATAYAAVRAVELSPGETVGVSGAAGGVGSIAVQLARRAGARVIGLAGESNHAWLRSHDVIPVDYGEGVVDRIRAVSEGKLDAFIDTFGGGYVEIALELGVPPQRIDTIIDFQAATKYGVKTEGNAAAADAGVLAELARMVAEGQQEVPIARVYPLERVQDAYREIEARHTRGKIVLVP
ncbi:MAG TPA: NADP-dependent oxidoreductase [Solirubrobacteraceae bacterium]|jgi:NADPH:quinone reductase-like Zn-dependent oxidoreductase|nr:NADP-dependent oxidoreductase [Solirubrobacteraceae bacterium]